jgi:hypothetical protein
LTVRTRPDGAELTEVWTIASSYALPARRGAADWAATLPVLAMAVLIAWLARWGPDWPAQEFRAWTAHHFGLTAWTNFWYSGEALPGYSVLYPPISAVIGAPITGVLAAVGSAYGASAFAPRTARRDAIAYRVAVGFVLACSLVIGQVPFLLGTAFGIGSLRAIKSGRPRLAAVLAAGASLSSPLAGAFTLLAGSAVASAWGWRRALPLMAAGAGIVTSSLLGGGGGPFPFEGHSAVAIAVFVIAVLLFTDPADRPIRVFVLSYGIASIAVFLVPNPIGGNMPRLGEMVALPMMCALLAGTRVRRRFLALALAGLAASWPAVPAVSSVFRGASDPSKSSQFYTGLLGFLHNQPATQGRLEVVFTREHWETLWVAQEFPIARGWERQTDLANNAALYQPLTASGYRQWLDDNAVSLVALPKAPIDYGGKAEAALLQHPPSYLIPVWHDANWQVWRVRDPRPLVTGAATLTTLGPASLVLTFNAGGTATIRIRSSGMWTLTDGVGCVGATGDGWLSVTAPHAEIVTMRSRIGVAALGPDTGSRCT